MMPWSRCPIIWRQDTKGYANRDKEQARVPCRVKRPCAASVALFADHAQWRLPPTKTLETEVTLSFVVQVLGSYPWQVVHLMAGTGHAGHSVETAAETKPVRRIEGRQSGLPASNTSSVRRHKTLFGLPWTVIDRLNAPRERLLSSFMWNYYLIFFAIHYFIKDWYF